MKRYTVNSSVTDIPGVGATREKQLAKLGVFTFKDLLYLFPRAYENRGNTRFLSEISLDIPVSVILTISTDMRSTAIKRGLTISKCKAFDESGACDIVFFNAPYVKDVFRIGTQFRIYGKASISNKHLQFINPRFEPIIEGKPLPEFVPVYPLTEGLNSKFIDKITKFALDETVSDIADPLPDKIRLQCELPTLGYAIKNAHFPENEDALKKALKRLAFDEMLCFGIGISLSSRRKSTALGHQFSPCDLAPLLDLLPYELTNSQKQTVNEIYKDTVFKKEDGFVHPMARIVVGDVGSGKTICAIIAMYIAAKSGYQSALMAPTEILARQHYADIRKLCEKLNIKCELLVGATTQKEKRRIYETLESGETDIVIGTHALISEKVGFSSLGLVITDEQHRFGVAQRADLKDKAKAAHMLVMSATPIPRTLALTMYGDLDVSRITEMPKGRMRVDTFVVDESYRERLNSFISKQVENGGQCYIVCPAIDAEDEVNDAITPNSLIDPISKSDLSSNFKNVLEHTDILRQSLPNLNIQCMHGKMKSFEKDKIMQSFSNGEINVLVSTTVIEVGVNVPNASLMIVENADRFGLAQLHQLRGRVGRGTRKSYCVLVSNSTTEKAKARLEIMRTTYDGYEIAEKDLFLRGPGDFFASVADNTMRQSGGFEFKLARLCDDTSLFELAFSIAKEITQNDPELLAEENKNLRLAVADYIIPASSTIS